MSRLCYMKDPAAFALCAALFSLACLQMLHALFTAERLHRRRPLRIAYEFSLLVHLSISALIAIAAYSGNDAMMLAAFGARAPLSLLAWANLACAGIAAALAARERSVATAVEAALLLSCTPAAFDAAGGWSWALLAIDASYFLLRTPRAITWDRMAFRAEPSGLSCIDAVDMLPQGILVANPRGRVLFMNNEMRTCLANLHLATDISAVDDLWHRLKELAPNATGPDAEASHLRIQDGDTVRLFMRDEAQMNGKPCWRLTEADVTEEYELNRAMTQANELLEAANAELSESLADVRALARADVYLHMRSRVHDTIGQKLSILTRYLEDASFDAPSIARIKALMHSTTDELADAGEPDSRLSLQSVCEAFQMIGCEIEVDGTLPQDSAPARACVDIVREAATNAVRHGQARRLSVMLQDLPQSTVMEIADFGEGSAGPVREGTGITGMRQAAADVGGTFSIASLSPFSIRTEIPKERAKGNRAARARRNQEEK